MSLSIDVVLRWRHLVNAYGVIRQVHNKVLGGTTVLPWNRGTSFSRYQHRRGHGTTVVPQYHNTAVLPYGTCQQCHFSENICDKNQVNKLEVFKLHVDDIWCNW